jgi:hypothetical protein
MNKKIRWITETAVMLALLICLQALTKPMGQLITGSCVNAVLAISVLVGGLGCGLTVALCSPVLAFALGIAPQILTVPAIMVGNTVFVIILWTLTGSGNLPRRIIAWLTAAAAKPPLRPQPASCMAGSSIMVSGMLWSTIPQHKAAAPAP